jgi:hypothetical protein
MGIKNLLDDVHKAVSIAQAGIKGTLESLKKSPSKAKKRTVTTRTQKKNSLLVAGRNPERNQSRIGVSGILLNSS